MDCERIKKGRTAIDKERGEGSLKLGFLAFDLISFFNFYFILLFSSLPLCLCYVMLRYVVLY